MRRLHAYTLFETLITIAIVSILLVTGIYAMQHMLISNRVLSESNHLITTINYARYEAITRNATITLCGSTDHLHCDGNWQAGQIVLQSTQVIRVFDALPVNDHLTWYGNFGQHTAIEFLASGFTNGQQGSFYYCPSTKAKTYGKRIVVEQTGRARVSDDASKCS